MNLFGRRKQITSDSREQEAKSVMDALDMIGITTKLNEQEKRLFVAIAVRNHLDPLKREIHAMERRQKVREMVNGHEVEKWVTVMVPVIGYEVFIDRAEQTGRLQYWYPIEEGEIKDKIEQSTYRVTVVIKRKDWPNEFKWTVKYAEVAGTGPVWQKEPSHQTMKVCISRAFRLCFREVLKGMTYTADEEGTIPDREYPTMIEPQERRLPVEALERELADQKRLEEARLKAAAAQLDAAVGTATPAAPTPAAPPEVDPQLLTARSELNAMYKKMQGMVGKNGKKLYSPEDIKKKQDQAVAAKDDIESLRDLAADWLNDLLDREEAAKA
jgi:hypothetical protein